MVQLAGSLGQKARSPGSKGKCYLCHPMTGRGRLQQTAQWVSARTGDARLLREGLQGRPSRDPGQDPDVPHNHDQARKMPFLPKVSSLKLC